MKSIIYIIISIIFYRLIAKLLNLRKNLIIFPIYFAGFICFFILMIQIYRIFCNTVRQPIEVGVYATNFPLTITLQHHVIRIPIEDRIDFEIEDRHNVHNKTIRRTAILAIEQLKKSDLDKYTITSAINEIMQIMSEYSPQISESAIASLQMIRQIDGSYHPSNIKELEILRLVWERIHHPINTDKVKQLEENFIKELADCNRGDGSVHCSEGRVTRLLQSLQSCDNENIVDLKPMWAFKEEVENKISKYRNKLIRKVPNKYSELEKKIELDDNDRNLMDQFNRCLVKNLEKRFEIDYIIPKYLTKVELNDMTKVYYESLYDYS